MRTPWLLFAAIIFACGENHMDGPTETTGGGAVQESSDADAGSTKDSDGSAGPSLPSGDKNKTQAANDRPDTDAEDPEGSETSQGSASIRHKVFVHGWGPAAFSSLQPLMQKMTADGVPAAKLHEIKYNTNGSLAQMSSEIAKQIRAVLDKVPAGEHIDVIGYSLGTFSSVHAVLENGLHERVAMMISMAGVERGQNKKPANCIFGCSDIYDFLTPFENDNVKAFYARHPVWKTMNKCAVHSPNDGMLSPFDANRFPESKVASVPGVSHTQMPKDVKVFQAIKKVCYENKWQ